MSVLEHYCPVSYLSYVLGYVEYVVSILRYEYYVQVNEMYVSYCFTCDIKIIFHMLVLLVLNSFISFMTI